MSVANAYAKALYQATMESPGAASQLGEIESQLDVVLAMFDASRDAQVTLLGPVATAKEKIAVIEEFGRRHAFQPMVIVFLSLLARKGRLSILREVREAFRSVRVMSEGGVVGRMVTADPVGEADVQSLSQAFTKKLGKPVAFQVSTDPALLAGMKVTVNGITYDGSLRSQLQRLRDRMMAGISST